MPAAFGRIYGFVNSKLYSPVTWQNRSARHYAVCSVDCHRHNRKIELHGKLKCTATESVHTAVAAARTLGKNDHRQTARQTFSAVSIVIRVAEGVELSTYI